ncbi:MAG: sodium-independent anion transporter, partial [Desulfofustis sp.]
ASGEEALAMLVKRIRSAGMGFAVCGVKGQILDVMERTGLYDEIGSENIYADSRAATTAIIEKIHRGTDLPEGGCGDCPLTQYLPLEDQQHIKEVMAT